MWPGKPAWGKAPGQAASLFLARRTGCRMGTSLPKEKGKYLYLVFSGSVKQCWVLPTNRPRQEPLLFITPGSNLCRDELSIGTVDPAPQGTTTGSGSGRNRGKGYASKFLFSLPVMKYVFCDACATQPPHHPGCPFPRPPRGRELPKEARQRRSWGSRRSHGACERCAHCYKLMDIGFKRTQVVVIDLAVSWEPGKSSANGWAAEQKELFRLHVAKKHLSAWETQPVGYHAVAHSGYLWSQFNFP